MAVTGATYAAAPSTSEKGLADYGRAIWRRKWTVLLTAVLAVAVALGLDSMRTKRYTSTASVLLTVPGTSSLPSSSAAAKPNVPTDIELITSSQVKQSLKRAIGSAPPVAVAQVSTTNVVTITATSTKPRQAAKVANAYALTYLTVAKQNYVTQTESQVKQLQAQNLALQANINQLNNEIASVSPANASHLEAQLTAALSQETNLNSQLNTLQQNIATASAGQVVNAAAVPSAPSSPKKTQDALFALGIGLLIGIGIALVRDHLDDRIRTRQDLELAVPGVGTIGLIPEIGEWRKRKEPYLTSGIHAKSPAAEAYRSLRTAVSFMTLDRPIKLLQVTSAAAADGKTTTTANLALAMAHAGQRVVVVGCDLRKPRIHEFFGVPNEPGFSSVLAGEAELEDVLVAAPGEENLAIVPSGPIPPNPSELLSSPTARGLFARLAASFDVAVIDSSPILPVTDGSVLASYADAVLLIAAADVSTQRDVRRALELLQRVNANVVGTVLNRASQSDAYVYYRYGYGRYGYGYGAEVATAGNGSTGSHSNGGVPTAGASGGHEGNGNGNGALPVRHPERGSP